MRPLTREHAAQFPRRPESVAGCTILMAEPLPGSFPFPGTRDGWVVLAYRAEGLHPYVVGVVYGSDPEWSNGHYFRKEHLEEAYAAFCRRLVGND